MEVFFDRATGGAVRALISVGELCLRWSHWDLYAVISLEAVAYSSYCNTVEWFGWD